MTTEQQKAINRIKKCLKLAGSSNENEAATAFRQAQALMAKYNLSRAEIDDLEVKESTQGATIKANPATWENGLAHVVGRAFGCKILFRAGNYFQRHGTWLFVGVDVAPELAEYAFDVLIRQLKRDRAEYVKTKLKRCKLATKRTRSFKFCESWVYAVYDKIDAMALDGEWDAVIARHIETHYAGAKPLNARENAKSSKQGQHADAAAGFAAGQQARLDRGVKAEAVGIEVLP